MDYTRLHDATIVPLIEKYGKAVYIRRPGTNVLYNKIWSQSESRYYWQLIASPYTIVYIDPATSPVDLPGNAIEVKYEQNEIDGTTIKAGDRRFKIADIASITTADKLIVGSSTILNIISVKPTQPGDVTLIYELQCRA